jgi:recombination protein RecA
MKGILDYIIEGTDPKFRSLGLIVLDSIAVLNTPLEAAAAIGKANMAPIPRFLSTELKKLTPVLAKANVAFIGINQVRVNLGQMFGDPTTSPGGKALKHACSLMINMAPVYGADNVIKNDSDERIGHKVRAKIQKNKVGAPFRQAEYFVEYKKGIVNTHNEIFDLSVKYGLIERPNSQSYIVNGEKIRGRDNAIKSFSEDSSAVSEYDSRVRVAYLEGGETSVNSVESLEENPLLKSIE